MKGKVSPASRGERAWYRVRQFWKALWAPLDHGAPDLAPEWLRPEELALFLRMPPTGQRHGQDVARSLVAQGYGERALLAAAFLHDVGKELDVRITLPHRVATVLLAAAWPAALSWLARQPWGSGFRVHFTHPERGAELARQAGSAPLTVDLIRRHHEPSAPGDDPRRWALWQADNAN
jgi:hypothetical protein